MPAAVRVSLGGFLSLALCLSPFCRSREVTEHLAQLARWRTTSVLVQDKVMQKQKYRNFHSGDQLSQTISLIDSHVPVRRRPLLEQTVQFHRTVQDVELMYELLLGGLVFEGDGSLQLRDEELASLRPAKKLQEILNRRVPRAPTAMEERLAAMSAQVEPLEMDDFERLVLGSVYAAYRVRYRPQPDTNLWIDLLAQHVNETLKDLQKGFALYDYGRADTFHYLKERPPYF
ncbi:protein FAM180A isoform X1 [Latimeria chalumnae]|uniref:protein FAM180A isoform X1 n=1 Tax=Latimeria chalumnae TaxID=7897 RepID=UPI0003C1665C|nr:PREDICTED: protein FAM180B isoform X2 [Latimeria chalumnae]|eukprot:XP_005987013.1 PREDICTED: protein FAM180B isoform X2 [Latimeria chalumnae]